MKRGVHVKSMSAVKNYMLDAIYAGLIMGGIMSLMLYAVGCEKL